LRLDDFVLYLDENLDNCKPIMDASEMAEALVAALPELTDLSRTLEPPFVIGITRSGGVTLVFDREGPTHLRRRAKMRIGKK
jgi:hypothetical protein